MKYEIHTRFDKGVVLPDWTPGMDRLSFVSPYPGVYEIMERMVANGDLSRYVIDDDHLVLGEEYDDLYSIFETSSGVQEMHDINLTKPTVISSTINERPDL